METCIMVDNGGSSSLLHNQNMQPYLTFVFI